MINVIDYCYHEVDLMIIDTDYYYQRAVKLNKLILLPTSFLDMYKLKLFCIVVLFCFDYIYLHVLNKCLNQ